MPATDLIATPRDMTRYIDAEGRVRCAMLRVHRAERSIDYVSVKPRTGAQAWRLRLLEAAQSWAIVFDYHLWAMPGMVATDPNDWCIYRTDALGRSEVVKRLPTEEAAEMWMLHSAP